MEEEEGGLNVICVCVELGDWVSEKLSGRVQLEGHSPKWRALQNFSFQPCKCNAYTHIKIDHNFTPMSLLECSLLLYKKY